MFPFLDYLRLDPEVGYSVDFEVARARLLRGALYADTWFGDERGLT